MTDMMDLLDDVSRQGREWSQFITDFLWYLRNLLLVGRGTAASEALEVSTDQLKLLQKKAANVKETTLIRYIRILSDLLNELRYATSKENLSRSGTDEMCRPQMETDQNSLLERVRQMEEKLAELMKTESESSRKPRRFLRSHQRTNEERKQTLEEKFPKAKAEELKDLVRHWKDVKRNLSPQMKYSLQKASLMVNEEGTALKIMISKGIECGKRISDG